MFLHLLFISLSALAQTIDVTATITALRLKNSITGGTMPASDPIFAQMVTRVQSGDVQGAALLAANSKYFANYLARRLAFQMQTPALDSAGVTDNDATTFLVAHFAGVSPTKLSTIWSENATYLVKLPDGREVKAATLSQTQKEAQDWTQLVRYGGQQTSTLDFIPVKHVGGYATLSDRANETSFVQWGATAGTNLRMIEGIWNIATGLQLMDVASDSATPQQVPRFIPEYDPNFFHGQGQSSCISCHGGGMASLDHGYATVANVFDFTGNGLIFRENARVNEMKSLGSDPGQRQRTLTCNLVTTPTAVCNPESPDVDPQQGWDVSRTWSETGVLTGMGWQGPTKGQGLQSLGYAIGQSWIMYQNFTQRVIGELCPLGTFSEVDINRISALANPWADPAGTDDIRTIVAAVAASPGCQ